MPVEEFEIQPIGNDAAADKVFFFYAGEGCGRSLSRQGLLHLAMIGPQRADFADLLGRPHGHRLANLKGSAAQSTGNNSANTQEYERAVDIQPGLTDVAIFGRL